MLLSGGDLSGGGDLSDFIWVKVLRDERENGAEKGVAMRRRAQESGSMCMMWRKLFDGWYDLSCTRKRV
mgnify:CR=1 FL=1